MTRAHFIEPDWPVPAGVRALSTLRTGGVSTGAYQGLNLGGHVGDAPEAVTANRELLARAAGLEGEPLWLDQVHSPRAVYATDWRAGIQADACVALSGGQVCAIMTADCLPVLFCDESGKSVAAAHAGWRGLPVRFTITPRWAAGRCQICSAQRVTCVYSCTCRNSAAS